MPAKARTTRPSRARAEVLGAAARTEPPTRQLPVVPEPIVPTLDDLAAELRAPVFRLLDARRPAAAAELLATYSAEADRALWREVLPGTGPLAVVR